MHVAQDVEWNAIRQLDMLMGMLFGRSLMFYSVLKAKFIIKQTKEALICALHLKIYFRNMYSCLRRIQQRLFMSGLEINIQIGSTIT